jgi:hypothetical protein
MAAVRASRFIGAVLPVDLGSALGILEGTVNYARGTHDPGAENRFLEEYAPHDPLSVESLPAVLAEVEIICAQRDLNNIIKFLYSRQVVTVRDLRELVTTRRLEIIRNTFVSVTGRDPVNLEVIAALAAVRGAANEQEEIESIKLQIHYRGAWDEIRREFTVPRKCCHDRRQQSLPVCSPALAWCSITSTRNASKWRATFRRGRADMRFGVGRVHRRR